LARLPIGSAKDPHASFLKGSAKLGDTVAKHVITAVAAGSFAIIVLVFAFVLREALPFFTWTPETPESDGAEVQETYGGIETGASADTSAGGAADASTGARGGGILEVESEVPVSALLGDHWEPVSGEPKFGLLPLLAGSFKVSLIAILLAAPIGIFAALYTSSIAPKWLREVMKPIVEILAGIPSVVIGFFALITMASQLQDLFGFEYRLNAFVGGVALAIAVVPIIYTITEDALSAVPSSLKEASLALGATRWQTALSVTLPAAASGVFASVMLGIGRAFGETMIVLMATGNAAIFSADLLVPVRTMSATVGAEMAEVVFGDVHYHILFLVGAILFVFTFALNATAETFIRRLIRKQFGSLS
jgi:phosphate transport system permease protein